MRTAGLLGGGRPGDRRGLPADHRRRSRRAPPTHGRPDGVHVRAAPVRAELGVSRLRVAGGAPGPCSCLTEPGGPAPTWTVSGVALAQDAHHLRAALRAHALSGLPTVLELRRPCPRTGPSRGPSRSTPRTWPRGPPSPRRVRGRLRGGLVGTMLGPSRHGCKHLERPFPEMPSEPRAVRCGPVASREGGLTHVGRRSEHRRTALGGTRVRALRGVPLPSGRPGPSGLRERRGRPRGVLGRAGRPAGLGQALGHGHDWTPPWVRWFEGGQLNASYNCLDRHVEAGGGDKVAYYWEGEPGEERAITYRELLDEVCRFANALKELGVRKGDRVAIYLGMVPELPVAMLACARIGAPHSVVFGGFSSESLRDRIIDAEAKVLVTADGGYRRGAVVPLKANADEALKECPTIEHVITVRRTGRRAPVHRGTRRLVPRADRGPVDGVRARADGLGGSAVPPVHERHDREAEGDRRTRRAATSPRSRPPTG